MFTKGLKISDTTKKQFLQLIYFQSDRKVWQRYYRADLSNVSDTLTYWVSISVLRGGFLGI